MAQSEGFSRGGFSSGRGGLNQPASNDNQSNSGFASRGGFGPTRGSFGQSTDSNQENFGFASRGGGRGGSNNGRGGGFGQSNDNQENSGFASRGGYSSRGSFGQSTDNNQENSGFASRGGFSSRGSFGQSTENSQESSGFGSARGGGRGGSNNGRGGGFGQSNDNQENSGFSSRGGFGSRGSFGQFTENNQESSGFGSARGGGRGGFGSGRGASNDNNQDGASRGGRGGFGSFGQSNGENSAFGSTRRGGFNQDGAGGRTCYKCQGEGHMARECPNADSAGGGFNQNGGAGGRICYKCQENGHTARECPNVQPASGNVEAGAEGGNTQQTNRADGETLPERAPINFVPQARKVDELFSEDQQAAKEYADVVDHDEEVVTENFSGSTLRIQKWEEAEFEPQLLTNIKERSKYSRPRKIQGATIPFILDGFDIKSQAETGSGKTAAFVLPIIDSCMKAKMSEGEGKYESELASPFAIIIGPTRELVMQVFEQAEKFAADTNISVAKAYGQYNIGRNHAEIRCGCDILVATPGRLKQFVTNGEIHCNKLKFLVLDEADRLLDQNFSVDIMEIVNTPGFPAMDQRQTLLFSATFPDEMAMVTDQLLKKEAVFVTNHRNNPNKRIKQDFIVSDRPGKLDKLCDLLKAEAGKVGGADKIRRTLVFVNTKRMSDMAAMYLCQRGIPATSINGDRGQHLREQALSDFRNHKVSVLCATDVCARGIDVKQLDHVINMDLPADAVTYVHRIGRTGRIANGWSTTFIEGGEPLLNEIADMIRESNEEVPESLKAAISGSGGGIGTTSANNVPVSDQRVIPAAADENDDW